MPTHINLKTDQTTSPHPMPTYQSGDLTATNGEDDGDLRYPAPTAEYHQIAENADFFLESLQSFHSSFGTLFSVPTIAKKALDLHHLFVEVTSRGGIEKVIKDRRWKEVVMAFDFPPTITSASFVLRKHYLSLLYHFEQAYYLRKQTPPSPPSEKTPPQSSCSMNGIINAKFDGGYVVTVKLDSEYLMGVLYHVPHVGPESTNFDTNTSVVKRPWNRKRSRMALQDPSHPSANNNGYDLFFSEQYDKLKPLYSGQENSISTEIAINWSNLSEAEKQVYQVKGLKEESKTEMMKHTSFHN